MILQLKSLLLTNTATGSAFVSVMPDDTPCPNGMYFTGNYLITAFSSTCRLWIGDLRSGEGMAVVAEDLEQFLFNELDIDDQTVEVPRKQLDELLGNYFGMRF